MTSVLAGRDRELAVLGTWLDEACAGEPRVVMVSGDPGSGKTCLVNHFAADANERGLKAVLGRAVEHDGAPPLWPWRKLLEELHGPSLVDPVGGGDPPSQRFVRFDRAARFLTDLAKDHGGLVVGVDDIHSADVASMRLFAHLTANLGQAPLVLMATFRSSAAYPESVTALLDEVVRLPGHRSLSLPGLDRSAVAAVLGADASSDAVDRVYELSGGNALFVTELARHGDGRGGDDEIPDSLRALVSQRLRARTPRCREMLAVAAAAGREFAAAVVANAADRSVLDTLTLIDEAIGAGLLMRGGVPGWFRFTHLVVHDIVYDAAPNAERPLLHQRLAEAIEGYEGDGDDHVHDLANHWDHAAMLGHSDLAATWNERAAEAADRVLAWEEATRLYDRALTHSNPHGDTEARYRRLLGSARGLLHSQRLPLAVERCAEAADVAHGAGRPDLAADAVLVLEGRGGSAGPEVAAAISVAERALAAVDPTDHTRRARLLGFLAAFSFYADPSRCEELSAAAANEASLADSPHATIAAVRAQQMLRLGPGHAEERLALATEIGQAGRAIDDPSVTQWDPLWRIDALLELGDLRQAQTHLSELHHLARRSGHPVSRWHANRTEAVLAAATGRWDDARHFGNIARDLHRRYESDEAAVMLHLALETTIGLHTGFRPEVLDEFRTLDLTRAPGYIGDIPTIVPLLAKLALGRREEATLDYARLRPLHDWTPAPFLWLPLHTMRLLAAIELNEQRDIRDLADRLAHHRGQYVVGGGGPIAYLGPVELHVGHAALALGDHDTAVARLHIALGAAAAAASPPFEVRTAALLVEALHGCSAPTDHATVRSLASTHAPAAAELGMQIQHDYLQRNATPEPSRAGSLTARELEVAALVADGLTNHQIAAALYISDRTAQNHVQHILTKLGLTNRTQAASWYHAGHHPPMRPPLADTGLESQ